MSVFAPPRDGLAVEPSSVFLHIATSSATMIGGKDVVNGRWMKEGLSKRGDEEGSPILYAKVT